jgi:hypothetical protein
MAEIINDVYQLEFDGKGFESEIQSLISQVQELESAMIDAQASGEDLGDMQNQLTGSVKKLDGVLGRETSSIDGLNQKQQILTKTQDGLNSESAAYNSVTKANTSANKQLSTAVVSTTKNQKSLGKSLLGSLRSFNSVRRAGQALGSVFRLIAGISPFGLLLTVGPSILAFFTGAKKEIEEVKEATVNLDEVTKDITKSYFKETEELDNLFGALNEANKAGTDKSAIISEIQSKYGDYIGNINLETASQEQLEIAYRAASEAILDRILIEAKAAAARQILQKIVDRQIEAANQQTASNKATTEAIKEQEAQLKNLGEQGEKARTNFEGLAEASKAIIAADAQKDTKDLTGELDGLNDAFVNIEKNVKDAILEAVDFNNLTGSFSKSAKTATKSTQALAGSISALESQLSALQKILKEQRAISDDAGLAEIQKQIEAQQVLVEAARKKLADLQGVAEAEANIDKLRTELLLDESERKISILRNAAAKERDAVLGTEEQKAEQIRLINEKLARNIEKIRQDSIDATIKAIDEETERIRVAREQAAAGDLVAIEQTEARKLAIRLQSLEKERNQALVNAGNEIEDVVKRNLAIELINEEFDKRRVELEKSTQRLITEARIASIEATIKALESAGETAIEQKAEVEKLILELVELQRIDPTVKIKADTEEAQAKVKEFILNILPLIQEVGDAIFSALAQSAAALTERLDAAVQKSQSALDNIRQNSEDFNADQLALEKNRLQELEAARAAAAQKEQDIAVIQVAANSAVAIARAAAEGGIAAPFTIAATLIALIAGLAQARNAASGAFFTGTEYLERNGAPKGRDTINIRAHEGERIVPTANNLKYFDAYSAFQNEKIPAGVANMFASGYLKGGLTGAVKSLSGVRLSGDVNVQEAVGGAAFFFTNSTDNSRLEKRMEMIEHALRELPRKMPVSTFNVDRHGLYMSTKKYIGKMEAREQRAK